MTTRRATAGKPRHGRANSEGRQGRPGNEASSGAVMAWWRSSWKGRERLRGGENRAEEKMKGRGVTTWFCCGVDGARSRWLGRRLEEARGGTRPRDGGVRLGQREEAQGGAMDELLLVSTNSRRGTRAPRAQDRAGRCCGWLMRLGLLVYGCARRGRWSEATWWRPRGIFDWGLRHLERGGGRALVG